MKQRIGDFYVPHASKLVCLALWVYIVYHFVAKLLLLNASTSGSWDVYSVLDPYDFIIVNDNCFHYRVLQRITSGNLRKSAVLILPTIYHGKNHFYYEHYIFMYVPFLTSTTVEKELKGAQPSASRSMALDRGPLVEFADRSTCGRATYGMIEYLGKSTSKWSKVWFWQVSLIMTLGHQPSGIRPDAVELSHSN